LLCDLVTSAPLLRRALPEEEWEAVLAEAADSGAVEDEQEDNIQI
jgi:hypothetical protein